MSALDSLLWLMPEAILALGACVVLAWDLVFKKARPWESGAVGLTCLAGASFFLFQRLGWGEADVLGMVRVDFHGTLFQLAVALSAAAALILEMADRHPPGREGRTETVFLLMAGVLGAFFLLGTWNLMMLYLGFEGLGLAVYALVAVRKWEKDSAEAGVKALVYGALSSGLMLYGISLLYGLGGSLDLREIGLETARVLASGHVVEVAVPFLLLLAGFGFKLAFLPFHFWAPDVYQGSSTPVLSFLAVASKVAGAAAFLRVLAGWLAAGLDGGLGEVLAPTIWILAAIAAATMLLGSLAALKQKNLHRLLGWSSVAQGGFFLIGVALLGRYGFEAASAYLLVYGLTMIGIVAAAFFLSRKSGGLQLRTLRGLGRTHPWVGVSLVILLASLVGLPPTAGFFAKWLLLVRAWEGGLGWLVMVAGLSTILTLVYALRLARPLFLESETDRPSGSNLWPVQALVVGAAAGVVALFHFTPVLDLARKSVESLRFF